jgi:hypothetical protein
MKTTRFNCYQTALIGFLTLVGLHAETAANTTPELRLTAKYYPLSAEKTGVAGLAPTYEYKSEAETIGSDYVLKNTYTYPENGPVLAIETIHLEKDEFGKLKSYELDQRQLETKGKVEIKDGKAFFSYTAKDKTKTDDEKISQAFLVGPMILPFLRSNREQILSGKAASARFAVVDRRESVGFEFTKENETMVAGETLHVIKMRPSSTLIAALVDPLRFYITTDWKHLREVHGRTLLKLKDGSDWKNFDALTVYKEVAGAEAGKDSK